MIVPARKILRRRLLLGASATALVVTAVAADAQSMFRKTPRNPAEQAAAAAAQRATQNQAASTATRRTIEAFTRASAIRQRMDAAQAAARAAAMAAASNVPNGLGQGGLQAANGVATDPSLWIGANGPTQASGSDGRTKVEVGQTEAKAILTWDSFNVGRETDLTFNQKGNTDWVALNRVTDASASPSRILGSIKADGTVLILNRNGVIFGGSAQVNTRNLVAAAADISNDQFLNRGIYSANVFGQLSPSFTDALGAVKVEAGAQITTRDPATVTQGGGYVMLLGGEVENAGSITSNRGQTLLAAGDGFLIRPGVSTDANRYSSTRGNEVNAVRGIDSLTGAVANTGVITAAQGDITLTGHQVTQAGVALATTSVNQRGTIHLLNPASDATGAVTLASGSLTAILPELDSDDTAVNSQRDALIADSVVQDAARAAAANAGLDGIGQFDNLSRLSDRRDQSRVEIVTGGNAVFAGDSLTLAQGGQVVTSAAGRIQTLAGAEIKVSGVRDVMLDIASNAIRVNIQGNELRDSPVNREAALLNNQNVWVDVRDLVYVPSGTGGYVGDRYYTPGGLLEVGGTLGLQTHTIGEWASLGGTITLQANEVVADAGSVFDISGGSLSYAAGSVLFSRVLGADGRLRDINEASALTPFVAVGNAQVVKHGRWGPQYAEVYSNPLFNRGTAARKEDGYAVGRDAGRLVISAPTVVLEGDILADVVSGARQTLARPDGATDGYKLSQDVVAKAGTLSIERVGGVGADGAFDTEIVVGDVADVTGAGTGIADPLPTERTNTALLDATRLNGYGLGGLDLVTAGSVSIDQALTLTNGGALTIAAAVTDIDADVTARGGSVTVGNVAPFSAPSQGPSVLTRDGTSSFTVSDGATIDLRGVWTNGPLDPASAPSTAFIDGGDLSVRMVQGSVTLAAGSAVDVSSGATLFADGTLAGGRGGNVSLIAGASVFDTSPQPNPGGIRLTLDGAIRAQGVTGGGTLTLQSPTTILFGEDSLLTGGVLPGGVAAPTGLVLAQPVTIPIGGIVPIDAYTSLTTTVQDVPQPLFVQPFIQTPVVTAAEWTLPGDVSVGTADGGFFVSGSILPAGSQITYFSGIPIGTVLPSAVFPDGVPTAPYDYPLPAGTVSPVVFGYTAGQPVAPGVVFAENVAFEPALNIDPALLKSGFSDYRVTSLAGLQVTQGAALRPETPVMRLTPASYTMATGADPAAALESWTPPVYLEDPANARFVQRAGASLSLYGADLGMAAGSSIAVDPDSSVRLASSSQLTVDGMISAPGGDIAIVSEVPGQLAGQGGAGPPGTSIWIGEHATLDVAGRAVTATDRNGRRYGLAPDGGSIRVGLNDLTPVDRDFLGVTSAYVIIRDGARLDASGAATDIDIPGEGFPATSETRHLAGDGGLIRIGSRRAIYNDGDLRAAAGGDRAAGGTLNLVLENSPFVSVLTIGQDRTASGLPGDLVAGVDDPALTSGVARISVEEIAAGGFGTLDLFSRDVFSFDGDVDLTMRESLILRRGAFSVSDKTPAARVSLAAPYVLLQGKATIPLRDGEILTGLVNAGNYLISQPSSRNDGFLSIRGDLVDIQNQNVFGASGQYFVRIEDNVPVYAPIDLAGFAAVDIASSGDLRFTNGSLSTYRALTLTAAQLYPTTGATGEVRVGGEANGFFNPDSVLTIRGNGGPALAAPLSVFGKLTLAAPTIDQGGIVRAPLGRITFGVGVDTYDPEGLLKFDVTLRAGSVTSVSAEGLTIPYGGTSDGLIYRYDGQTVEFRDLAQLGGSLQAPAAVDLGIVFSQTDLTAEAGSLLDVSGGGKLTGAGFFTGRGGSVDVLRTALGNANPAAYGGAGAAEVYAIVPGYAGDYAPVQPDEGFGAPAVGRQITLDHAVGDLPAGTYTLMPSTFALLPGAFRVELGAGGLTEGPIAALPDGSFRSGGYLGTANTAVRDVLPTAIIVTPAAKVRTFSQYNETSYADFAITNAATFGALRPRLERDASVVQLDFGTRTGELLDFDGAADLTAADGGVSGTLFVTGGNSIEIKPAGDAVTDGFISLDAGDLSQFNAGTLSVGSTFSLVNAANAPELGGAPLGPRVVFRPSFDLKDVTLRDGATLSAGQIFLVGRDVLVESGAVLDTTRGPTDGINSSLGYVFSDTYNNRNGSGAILTVANGLIDFTAPLTSSGENSVPNSITIEDGAALRTLGTISFSSNGAVALGEAELNARYLSLVVPTLNIGTTESFAAAEAAGALGTGVRLNEATLDRLLRPTLPGQIPVERISLTVGGSINLFGDVALDVRAAAGGSSAALILNTPALYGWGEAGDVARIGADTLIWNGIATGAGTPLSPTASVAPGAVIPGGAGTGKGTLSIDARRIEFGYDPLAQSQDQVALDRLTLGFATVNLNASERVTANNRGTLAVYATGTDAASYAGGTLNINAPLLTGEAGSFMAYKTGGALTVTAPAGAAFDTAGIGALGGEVRLAGNSVKVDSAVALPSGRLVVEAADGITLTDRADIDLSGHAVTFFDVTKYSWGGDLVMEAGNGAITQGAGSAIDVSAVNNDAGAIYATATGASGLVDLAGTLTGTATAGYGSGSIDVRARTLTDFTGLNGKLTTGGFFEARSFVVKTGNLVIGDEVRAQRVTISADGGSLTVNGRIDASGSDVGTIRLAARDDLTLAAGAVLDVHGTVLATDSYGAAIEASNRGDIELTTATGAITLVSGATLDLRSADNVSRGHLEINAPRIGSDNVAVNAAAGLVVRGADTIAVNAFRGYTPGDGVIDQAYLDTIHADNSAFIDAANGNNAVAARLVGLTVFGDAFHLRPGVEIRSDGDLRVDRDIDLSGYRYGPGVDPAVYGSGEVGVLAIRAGGDLTINGSITDGFALPSASPDDNSWGYILPGNSNVPLIDAVTVPIDGIALRSGSRLTAMGSLGFDFTLANSTQVNLGSVIPIEAPVAYAILDAGTTLTAPIYNADGSILYAAGTTLAEQIQLSSGERLGAGFKVPTSSVNFVTLGEVVWPAGTRLDIFAAVVLGADAPLPAGAVIPAGSVIDYVGTPFVPTRTVGPDGTQGRMYANAPMLAAGSRSWSMRLVGGADLASADSRTLTAKSALGEGGDVLLDDGHLAGPLLDRSAISVIRTGTGYLDVLAGGDYRQNSLFGIYTAGTQIADSTPWNLDRAPYFDGTVLGADYAAYEATLNAQRMYFTEAGGDVTIAAQGDLRGYVEASAQTTQSTDDTGRWLWRQGGAALGQKTAWGINFGQYWVDDFEASGLPTVRQVGFSGIGTLGGGDVSVSVGGDAGSTYNFDPLKSTIVTSGLDIIVGGSGRIDADGVLTQTGGGTLALDVGGRLNTGRTESVDFVSGAGQFTNLRGNLTISAGSIGQTLEGGYGVKGENDPRAVDTQTPLDRIAYSPPAFTIGDGVARIATRGDLVMRAGYDAGRTAARGGSTAETDGSVSGSAVTSFSLWTDRSAISLFSAGGDLRQSTSYPIYGDDVRNPSIFSAVAAGGSINVALWLAPSLTGSLELLARDGLFGNAAVSGAAPAALATPQNPLWLVGSGGSFGQILASNAYDPDAAIYDGVGGGAALFAFGPDTASNIHQGPTDPIRLYAVTGDIALNSGFQTEPIGNQPQGYYVAAKPVRMLAGRDILTRSLFLNNDPEDVSVIRAGRDILNSTIDIAGPGTLEVTAGRNLYQALSGRDNGPKSTIDSIGPIVSGDTRDGAGIALIVGVGANDPDYTAFAATYFDAANLAEQPRPLAEQPGKVVKTYDQELLAWLKDRFGYEGDPAGALGYFQALPVEQQGVFVRDVYYEELRQGGREYNDPNNGRFGSYLRGRNAIATLLPEKDASNQPIVYDGSITYIGAAGTHTDFGGDIQILAPGGGVTLGATGVAPPPSTGLLTQGAGDIEVFTRGSILLGLSRVFTTFGGGITMWSAEGDINAGRGAKGTVVFAPARRLYDVYGNVDLAPTVPTSGAGIGTLNPIPEVPPGDIDLIAPLGTIDAGEAGIRVSGNVNLAALQIVNAANIDVKGKATGIPVAAAVNTGALTAASAAAGAVANEAARLAERARPKPITEVPTILNVRFLGFGEN